MSIWTWLWVGWVVAFIIVEWAAIKNDTPDDTLSEHLRKWFRTDTNLGRTAFLVAFGGFVAWFGVHILTNLA